jgi:hypothetical protein
MIKSNLLSGRVKLRNPSEVRPDRYEFIDLAQVEPSLGVPPFSASLLDRPAIVISDSDGNRGFTRALDLDNVTGLFTGSFSGSADLSGSFIGNFVGTADLDGTFTGSFTGSFSGDGEDLLNVKILNSGSAQATISPTEGFIVNTDTTILGNLYVSESIIAEQIIVSLISSSVIYSSGSNIFGENDTDIQQFTGSVQVKTELIAGFVTASSATGSFTGSFLGEFTGDGSGLFNIQADAAPRIASGSVTASVSPNFGFRVESEEVGSQFTGSVDISGSVSASLFQGDGGGLFNIPLSALTEDTFRIASGSVTASVSPEFGFRVESEEVGSQFTGSLFVSGNVQLETGSFFSGSGEGLFNIPRSALTEDALLSTFIASGSVTASVSDEFGFRVESLESGSQFTGSLFVSGNVQLETGSFFSGSGEGLFNIPRTALTDDALESTFIASGSVTASVSDEFGFRVESEDVGSQFTGSLFISGNIELQTGSFFSGSGEGLFNIPRSALTDDALESTFIASGSVTASVSDEFGFRVESEEVGSQFTGSLFVSGNIQLETGSFFSGSGEGLFNIPRSALTDDALVSTEISSGSVTASVSPEFGFRVESEEVGSQFTGSLFVSGNVELQTGSFFSGSGEGLFNIPRSALTEDALESTFIASGSVTASVSDEFGFRVESEEVGSQFTGSLFVSGNIQLETGSFFSGSGEGLFNIPRSALTEDALVSTEISSGSVTASVSPEFGFRVESEEVGSQFTGSLFVSGNIQLETGSFFSGSGEGLFNIPRTALTDDALLSTFIASGSVTASVSNEFGFRVESLESGSQFTGSLFVSGNVQLETGSFFSGSGEGLFNIPRSALTEDALETTLISSGSVTASVSPEFGFRVESEDVGSQFTGSLFVSGNIQLETGSFFSGSGEGLFNIPRTALTDDALESAFIASGSVTASVSDEFGFRVESEEVGSQFTGSLFVSGNIQLETGSFFSGSGEGLFIYPKNSIN